MKLHHPARNWCVLEMGLKDLEEARWKLVAADEKGGGRCFLELQVCAIRVISAGFISRNRADTTTTTTSLSPYPAPCLEEETFKGTLPLPMYKFILNSLDSGW